MPIRIQRKRTKGWKMPENTVYVGRGSKWGNPYYNKSDCLVLKLPNGMESLIMAVKASNAELVKLFEKNCKPENEDLSELKGKNLACWCKPDEICHADVLLKLANEENK